MDVGELYEDRLTRAHVMVMAELLWGEKVYGLRLVVVKRGTLAAQVGGTVECLEDFGRYEHIPRPRHVGTMIEALEEVVVALGVETDPTGEGDWDGDRLQNLGWAASQLYRRVFRMEDRP